MYVISVIPLTKNSSLTSLSYYSSVSYEAGTILSVPIRKREVPAIVITAEPVSGAKATLRAAAFSLRKLPPQTPDDGVPASLMNTAAALEKVVPAHLGSILFSLLPPDIRTGARPYPYTTDYTNDHDATPHILTALRSDRLMNYRSLIRQAFAHRGSVLLVVPQSATVGAMAEALKKGIDKRVVTFASTHTKKQLDKAYEAFVDFSTAKLIIATPGFAFLDRHDITTIIVDEAASPYYKSKTRPYLDAIESLRTYTKVTNRTIIFGDALVSTELEVKRRDDRYQTYEEHPQRLSFTSDLAVATLQKPVRTEPLPLFTDELHEAVTNTLATKGRVFLLTARRGFAPLLICNDCGAIMRCPDSGAPYALYITTSPTGEEERWVYCSTAGRREKAPDTCPQCSSWRLREQGIGIQRVVSRFRQTWSEPSPIIFDHTTATTPKKAAHLIKRFYEEKQTVLIGTQMALPYLTSGYQLGGIVSYEALRAYPSWRAEEHVLRTLYAMREQSADRLIVQTKDPDDPLLLHAKKGSLDTFYDEEIAMRQILSYPPFATLIHLTWQGDKAEVMAQEEAIAGTLRHIDMQCYNNPTPSAKIVRHALIKVPDSDWPNPVLVARLRSLPPSVRVEIGPERII